MMCERYWRDGILLVERGLDDPHRSGCSACTQAHASRQELIDALPLVGAEYTGDPSWQANVWQRIDGAPTRTPWRWRWQIAGALAAACAVVLWIGIGRYHGGDRLAPLAPTFEVVKQGRLVRGESANVDDRLRVTVGPTQETWIYHARILVLRCGAGETSASSPRNGVRVICEIALRDPGQYQVIVVDTPVALPRGALDEDRRALIAARAHVIDEREIPVY